MIPEPRDHGGGLDAAMARWGGTRADWLDLSTGINPVPYPIGEIPAHAWTALPDAGAMDRLLRAARRFWQVPDGADIIAAAGASALIARMPALAGPGPAYIPRPTYNEHAAAFGAAGVAVVDDPAAPIHVYVHPNNPDGRLWSGGAIRAPFSVIDESFCDITPDASHIAQTTRPGVVVLKSFGKFWGLAGLRLGFAIGTPDTLAPLRDLLGPWAVSGPALAVGARALADTQWAEATRARLAHDAARIDSLLSARGAALVGGSTLFRLYHVDDAAEWHENLAQRRILSRIFPYSPHWLRLGLPPPERWDQLEAAL
ncbi:MAG: threonine-phosphate decarboxylase [Paracoccaceae bacterium]